MKQLQTVPNQRTINIKKVDEKTNKIEGYTINNRPGLAEAAQRLQSKGGFKLYMYLAKNNDFTMALSSADFCEWAGLSRTAYNTAFEELVKETFLIPTNDKKTIFNFFEKPQNKETITVINDAEKVEAYKEIQKQFNVF